MPVGPDAQGVVCLEADAAAVGQRILERGGNAIDAVATALPRASSTR